MIRPLAIQATLAAAAVLTVGIATAHAASGDMVFGSGDARAASVTYTFTAHLAERFPQCEASLPKGQIPSGFLVKRLDGSFEVESFDDAWHRSHDKSRADDVWTYAQCR